MPSNEINSDIPNDIDWEITTRSLDLTKLLHLLRQGLKSASELKGKDAVFFFGRTGAGKTSTMAHLVGEEFEAVEVLENVYDKEMNVDITRRKTIIALKTENANLKIGQTVVSQTSVIFAQEIEFHGSKFVLVDTPGMLDTNGAEVDIANSFAFRQAIENAAKFAVIFTCPIPDFHPGNRGILARDLCNALAQMLPQSQFDQSIIFTLTQPIVNQDDAGTKTTIFDLAKTITPRNWLLTKMVQAFDLKGPEKRVFTIDLLKGNPEEFLDVLSVLNFVRSADAKPSFLLTENAKNALRAGLNELSQQFESWCQSGEFEKVLAAYLTLSDICSLVPNEGIGEQFHFAFSNAKQIILNSMERQIEGVLNPMSLKISPHNPFSEGDVRMIRQTSALLHKAQALQAQLLEVDEMLKHFESAVQKNLQTICDNCIEQAQKHEFIAAANQLTKLSLIARILPTLASFYGKAIPALEEVVNEIGSAVRQETPLPQLGVVLAKLNEVHERFGEFNLRTASMHDHRARASAIVDANRKQISEFVSSKLDEQSGSILDAMLTDFVNASQGELKRFVDASIFDIAPIRATYDAQVNQNLHDLSNLIANKVSLSNPSYERYCFQAHYLLRLERFANAEKRNEFRKIMTEISDRLREVSKNGEQAASRIDTAVGVVTVFNEIAQAVENLNDCTWIGKVIGIDINSDLVGKICSKVKAYAVQQFQFARVAWEQNKLERVGEISSALNQLNDQLGAYFLEAALHLKSFAELARNNISTAVTRLSEKLRTSLSDSSTQINFDFIPDSLRQFELLFALAGQIQDGESLALIQSTRAEIEEQEAQFIEKRSQTARGVILAPAPDWKDAEKALLQLQNFGKHIALSKAAFETCLHEVQNSWMRLCDGADADIRANRITAATDKLTKMRNYLPLNSLFDVTKRCDEIRTRIAAAQNKKLGELLKHLQEGKTNKAIAETRRLGTDKDSFDSVVLNFREYIDDQTSSISSKFRICKEPNDLELLMIEVENQDKLVSFLGENGEKVQVPDWNAKATACVRSFFSRFDSLFRQHFCVESRVLLQQIVKISFIGINFNKEIEDATAKFAVVEKDLLEKLNGYLEKRDHRSVKELLELLNKQELLQHKLDEGDTFNIANIHRVVKRELEIWIESESGKLIDSGEMTKLREFVKRCGLDDITEELQSLIEDSKQQFSKVKTEFSESIKENDWRHCRKLIDEQNAKSFQENLRKELEEYIRVEARKFKRRSYKELDLKTTLDNVTEFYKVFAEFQSYREEFAIAHTEFYASLAVKKNNIENALQAKQAINVDEFTKLLQLLSHKDCDVLIEKIRSTAFGIVQMYESATSSKDSIDFHLLADAAKPIKAMNSFFSSLPLGMFNIIWLDWAGVEARCLKLTRDTVSKCENALKANDWKQFSTLIQFFADGAEFGALFAFFAVEYKRIIEQLEARVDEIVTETRNAWDNDQVELAHKSYQQLCDCGAFNEYAKRKASEFIGLAELRVKMLAKQLDVREDHRTIARKMLKLKQLSNAFPDVSPLVLQELESFMGAWRSTKFGPTAGNELLALADAIKTENSQLGNELINELSIFQVVRNQRWARTTAKTFDIDYVLKNITGSDLGGLRNGLKNLMGFDSLTQSAIRSLYEQFEQSYEQLLNLHLANRSLDKLVAEANKLGTRGTGLVGLLLCAHLSTLIGIVFAAWTVAKSDLSFGTNKEFLVKPHPAQVVSIFRMLGMDTKQLVNHVIEIKTGEGKGVTLAVTAIVLALFGIRVDCVCYSQYLSARDFKAFEQLFESFGVKKLIKYDTIKRVSERMINREFDLRDQVLSLMRGQKAQAKQVQASGDSVLLIDEVDVFFGADFFGKTYNVTASLKGKTLFSVVSYIYDNAPASLDPVKAIPAYAKLMQQYPGCEDLINVQLNDIVNCRLRIENHLNDPVNPPKFRDGKVGYQSGDQISFTTVKGNLTTMAYFHGWKAKGTISEQTVRDFVSLPLLCGRYSFAKIPNEYKVILGVTGTLQTLEEHEKEILSNYGINRFTFIPSVFAESKLTVRPTELLDIEPNWMGRITEVALQESNKGRPVLIFFEDESTLQRFRDNPDFGGKIPNLNSLADRSAVNESLIKRATTLNQVTLFTAPYGRGTDFVCFDDKVKKLGGPHVIHAYYADTESDDVQVRGRTARQGEKGSYQQILCLANLAKLEIKEDEAKKLPGTKNIDSTLIIKRKQIRARIGEKVIASADLAENWDSKSRNLVKRLNNITLPDLVKELIEWNSCPSLPHTLIPYHSVVCIDRSGSMDSKLPDGQTRYQGAINSTAEFLKLRAATSPGDVYTIITYNDKAQASASMLGISKQLPKLPSLGGGTSFAAPLKEAITALDKTPAGYSKLLFFLGDGESNDGEAEMDQLIQKFPDLVVYTVAFGDKSGQKKLEGLAARGKGTFLMALTAAELKQTFEEVLSEIAE